MAGTVFPPISPALNYELSRRICCSNFRGVKCTQYTQSRVQKFQCKLGILSSNELDRHRRILCGRAVLGNTVCRDNINSMKCKAQVSSEKASLDAAEQSNQILEEQVNGEFSVDEGCSQFSEDSDEDEKNREIEYYSDEEKFIDVQDEALELLEWPALCRQLANFTATPMGTTSASRTQLQLGETIDVSKTLLDETAAALALGRPLDFSGIENISETISKANDALPCSVEELWDVATTLKAAVRLHGQLGLKPLLPIKRVNSFADENSLPENGEDGQAAGELKSGEVGNSTFVTNDVNDDLHKSTTERHDSGLDGWTGDRNDAQSRTAEHGQGALQSILQGANVCLDLLANLEHCLDGSMQKVLDRASRKLANTRVRRAANSKELQGMLGETARKLYAGGASDGPLVVLRRGRYCVGVRAGFKNLLPGGITLDVSNSGATLFIEPEPAIRLNNAEAELASQEAEEIGVVLARLANQGAGYDVELKDLIDRLTTLDLAVARAAHAVWLGGVRPKLVDLQAVNPLLTLSDKERGIKTRTAVNGADESLAHVDGLWKVYICDIRHPLLLASALPRPKQSDRESGTSFHGRWQEAAVSKGDASLLKKTVEDPKAALPVPIDIKVSPHVTVVAITGPNTGGKTAALKTLGMAALMAKAGFYIPSQGDVIMPWFDHVLADIGDEQSLEQNLSTFSGHIRRLGRILKRVTLSSLVLLDEVGSGTDPSEGASLATAVLHHLADAASLSVATTHYAELKTLKASDPRMENASVEFNTETLRPTYRVLWGQAGQSNAFIIAESLNFDGSVLKRARELGAEMSTSLAGIRANALIASLMAQKQGQERRAAAAQGAREKAEALHAELKVESEDLQNRERLLLRQQEQELSVTVSNAQRRVAAEVARLKKVVSGEQQDEIDAVYEDVKAQISSVVQELLVSPAQLAEMAGNSGSGVLGDGVSESGEGKGAWMPSVGDKVVVRRLGMSPVIVVERSESGEELAVQLGMMRMSVKLKEVLPVAVLNAKEANNVEDKLVLVQKGLQAWQAKVNLARSEEAQKAKANDSNEPVYEARVQTSANTVDLRGMRVDDAVRELDLSLAIRPAGSVVFVVHGIGTGAVKQAVIELLQKHRAVAKFEPESRTNLGCTVAYIN